MIEHATFTDIEAEKEGFKNLADFIAYWKKNIGDWNSNKVVWIHVSVFGVRNFAVDQLCI